MSTTAMITRAPSPASSTSSSTSTRSDTASLYGSIDRALAELGFQPDDACFSALDDALLLDPQSAFAAECFASAVNEPRTHARRSVWVHGGMSGWDWDDEEDAPPAYDLAVNTNEDKESMLEFRRPSSTSTIQYVKATRHISFVDMGPPTPCSVTFAPIAESPQPEGFASFLPSPAPKGGILKSILRRRS